MFPSRVMSVHFLTEQGNVDLGFVGTLSNGIYRTTDHGATWWPATSPAKTVARQFYFKNKQEGWCALSSDFDGPAIARTNDGGATWTALDPHGIGMGVNYHPTTKLLFLQRWSKPSLVSSDDGNNWTQYSDTSSLNGIAFNGMYGFNGSLSGNSFYTSDGGVSWTSIPKPGEFWQVATKDELTYFGIEDNGNKVYKTTTGGSSWSNVGVIPYGFASGMMKYIDGTLIVQTGNNGFLLSRDEGVTWSELCGPSNVPDSRFYAMRDEIFAGGSKGMLYRFTGDVVTYGGTSLSVDNDTLRYISSNCSRQIETLFFRNTQECANLRYDSLVTVYESGSKKHLKAKLKLDSASLSTIALILEYTSGEDQFDTTIYRLYYNAGGFSLDTTIVVYGRKIVELLYTTLTLDEHLIIPACTRLDTAVFFRNASCDKMVVHTISLAGAPEFTMPDIPLPDTLMPGESIRIPLSFFSGTEGEFLARLDLDISNFEFRQQRSFLARVNVEGAQNPLGRPVSILAKSYCEKIDTKIVFENPTCDSILLMSLDLGPFAKLSDAAHFPISLGAGDNISFPIHFTLSQQPHDQYIIKAHIKRKGVLSDISLPIDVTVSLDTIARCQLEPSSLQFGSVALCNKRELPIALLNTSCAPFTIQRIIVRKGGTYYTIPPSNALPLLVAAADSIIIPVTFDPQTAGMKTGELIIDVEQDGKTRTITIPITGDGAAEGRVSLRDTLLTFDTVRTCTQSFLSTYVQNGLCDSVQFLQAALDNSQDFELLEPPVNDWIANGDSVQLLLKLKSISEGAHTGKLRLFFKRKAGTEYTIEVPLWAFVTQRTSTIAFYPPVLNLQSTTCEEIDTLFVIKNLNECDSLYLVDILSESLPDIVCTVASELTLPTYIAPKDSVIVKVHLSSDKKIDKIISLQVKGEIDTSYNIRYKTVPSKAKPEVVLEEPLRFMAKCEPVVKYVTVRNAGCDSLLLLSQVDNGAINIFTVSTDQQWIAPGDSKRVGVSYYSATPGEYAADLHLQTEGFDTLLPLQGASLAFDTLSFGFRTADGSHNINANAGDTIRFDIITQYAIAPKLFEQGIQGKLSYPDRSLTLLRLEPGKSRTLVYDTVNTIWSVRPSQRDSLLQGEIILSAFYYATISDSLPIPVEISQLKLGVADSILTSNCYMLDRTADTCTVLIAQECEDKIISAAISSSLPFRDYTIYPNPLEREGEVVLSFTAQTSAVFTVGVYSELGKLVRTETVDATTGRNNVAVQLGSAANGTYDIILRLDNYRESRRLVISK